MNSRRRMGAAALCVVIVLAILVSSAYIIHEAGHDCTGDDCTVCRTIYFNSQLLRVFGAVLFALFFLRGISGGERARHNTRGAYMPLSRTPVSWKIRLNN